MSKKSNQSPKLLILIKIAAYLQQNVFSNRVYKSIMMKRLMTEYIASQIQHGHCYFLHVGENNIIIEGLNPQFMPRNRF